jgi:molybdopterin-guanine dinucleotide biosynthesis protein B
MRSAPVTSIRLRDPLAASLGLAGPDGCVTITLDDVARTVGRLDPVVPRVFGALAEALAALYRDGLPVRGEIDADISGTPDDPYVALTARTLTAVIAATPEEVPGRSGRLKFLPQSSSQKVRLMRHDHRDTTSFQLPRGSANGPDVAELLKRASRGRTSTAERDALHRAFEAGSDAVGPPIITILGMTNTGKTALTTALIQELRRLGLRVGAIKQTAAGVMLDRDGSETWPYTSAGASAVASISPAGVALVRHETEEIPLAAAVALMPPDLHVVICEGYREAGRPSIVVCAEGARPPDYRLAEARLLATVAPRMLATVGASSCGEVAQDFARGDAKGLAAYLVERLELRV